MIWILFLLLTYIAPFLYSGDRKTDYLELRRLIGKEKLKEAISRCKQLIDIYPDYLYLYETLAEASQYAGDLDNAVKYFEQRIGEGSEIAWAYFGLGSVFYYKKDYRTAVLSLNKAIELGISAPECFKTLEYAYERLEGVDAAIRVFNSLCHRNPDNANYWYALGLAYWSKSEFKAVLTSIEEALVLNPSEPKYLEAKGVPLLQIGDQRKGFQLVRQLLPLAEKRGDLAGSLFLRSVLVFGYLDTNKGDSASAETQEMLREAGEFGFLRWLGWGFMQKADLEYGVGDYENALLSAQKALESSHRVNDTKITLETMFLKLKTCVDLGNYEEALECTTLIMRRSQAKSYDREYACALSLIAWTYTEIGDYNTALEYGIEALMKAESLGSDPLLVQIHTVLGNIYEYQGEYQVALNHYSMAHRLVPVSDSWARTLALSHNNLGNLYLKQGEFAKSKMHLHQQVAIAQKAGFKPSEALGLASLGNYYLQTGEYTLASKHYLQGLKEAEKISYCSVILICQRGLGHVAEVLGHNGQALSRYHRAVQIGASKRFGQEGSFSGRNLRTDLHGDYEDYIRLLCSLNRINEAFEAAEKSRLELGSSLIGLCQRKLATLMTDSSRARVLQVKSELEQKYAALTAQSREASPVKSMDRNLRILSDIENLETSYRRILDTLRDHDPKFYDLMQPSPMSVRRLRELLIPHDQALLQYVVGDKQTDAFLVKSDTLLHFTIKKGRVELSKLLGKISYVFEQGNSSSHLLSATLADFDVKQSFEFYNLLMKPVESDLRDIQRIIIVADDVLKSFPFEVLAATSSLRGSLDFSGAHYLVERYEISYALGASFLDPRYRTIRQARKSLLAIGNPTIVNMEGDSLDNVEILLQKPTDMQFLQSLPGAQREVDCIGRVFENKADILVRDKASKAFFKQFASDYKVLHIAAHATIDNNRPMYSSIHLASDRETRESGAFRAFDFFNVELNADLAVLSACNTGNARRGQGLDGFVRGLFFAGVPSVISAMWSVEDESTAQLMESFYQYLKNGERKSRALQLAKLDLIKSGKADPFYWGAFVLVGDTSPIDFSQPATATDWTWIVLLSIGSGFAAIMIYKRASIYWSGEYRSWQKLKSGSVRNLERP